MKLIKVIFGKLYLILTKSLAYKYCFRIPYSFFRSLPLVFSLESFVIKDLNKKVLALKKIK